MADAEELAALTGDTLRTPEDAADTGVRTLGGVMCIWRGEDDGGNGVRAYALPRDVVPTDVQEAYSDPVCEGYLYDGTGCRVAIADEETWLLVSADSFLPGEEVDENLVRQRLADVVPVFEGSLPDAGSPAAAVRTDRWWPAVTCAELAELVPLASLLDGDIQEGYPSAFGSDVPDDIAERLGTTRFCPWYTITSGGELEAVVITVYPGGGWDYEREVARVEAEKVVTPLTVEGATAAVAGVGGIRADGSHLLATDGVNLLEQLEAPDPGAAAAAFLAGLSAAGS